MDFAHSPPHSFGCPPRPYSASRLTDRHSPTTAYSLSSYSFPPAAPPLTSDGVQRIVSPPILSSFAVDPATESHFSYQPPPVDSPHSLAPFEEGAHRPRSYSEFGLDSFANDYSNLERQATPEPLEFSTLGRIVFEGGDARQTIASFSFAQFLPPIPSPEHLPPIPDLPPAHHPRYYYSQDEHRSTYPAFPQYTRLESPAYEAAPNRRTRAEDTSSLEWAKPRNGPSSSSQPRRQPQREAYSFPPIDTSPRSMQRTVSNQTASTTTTLGSSETYYENDQYSDEGFIGQGVSEEGGDAGMIEEFDDFDLQEPVEEEKEEEETPKRRQPIQQVEAPLTKDHTPPQTRSKSSSIKSQRPARSSGGDHRPKAVPGLFRPSPESMLASSAVAGNGGGQIERIVPLPCSSNRGRRTGQAWNAPALPDSIDFSSLPTKKSRGRRPPTAPELRIDEQANESGDTEYAGLTKTGKPKKIWLCKVRDCGRVFKRGEHLQRHVRSIHTDDKPFQCQWEGCGKFFSRHDNLNQHLRVHRELGLTDQEFSQQIAHHFNARLMSSGKVQPSPTVRKRQPTEKGRSKKSASKGKKGSSRGKERERETSAEDEEGEESTEAEQIHDTI